VLIAYERGRSSGPALDADRAGLRGGCPSLEYPGRASKLAGQRRAQPIVRAPWPAITSAVDELETPKRTAACHARLIAHVRRAGVPRRAHDLIVVAHALQDRAHRVTLDAKSPPRRPARS